MIALVLAFAYTTEARTNQWVSPWEMELIEPYGDCTQLCGNWSALFLSNGGCTSDSKVTGDTLRFCPDKEAVEAWTVDNEENYVAMHQRADELLMSERQILELMVLERTMKLSVHPWQQFQFQKVVSLVERRRKQASSSTMRCVGKAPLIGKMTKNFGDERPQKVILEFELNNGEKVISHFQMKYASNTIRGGTAAGNAKTRKKLPDCVTVVFTKSTDQHINALNFLSQGKETRLQGDDINDSTVLVAPSGKCLGDIRMRYDEFVNRLCFRFNSDE